MNIFNRCRIKLTSLVLVSIYAIQAHQTSTSSPFDISNERLTESLIGNESLNPPKTILPLTAEEIENFKMEQYLRMQERREQAKEKMKDMVENPHQYMSEKTERLSEEQIDVLREEILKTDPNLENEEHRWLRNNKNYVYNNNMYYTENYNKNQYKKYHNNRNNKNTKSKNSYHSYETNGVADASQYFSEWAQAYRMLGAYISCDNGGTGFYGGKDMQGCSRWLLWAAYVDPNYQGYGRNEYFGYNKKNDGAGYYGGGCQRGDDGSYHCYGQSNINNNINEGSYNKDYTEPVGKLDCHSVDTEWILMGIYRQEFYEFFEQITKHLWYINDYEYIVAYTGLKYLNNGECNLGGYDEWGNEVYAAPKPVEGGSFVMSLYKDWQCLMPYESQEKNYDEFFGNYRKFEDYADDDYYVKSNAKSITQEYTLTLFNEVFEEFKYCTLCIDYPSYQDGYFNGNYGTDEDDLINQCWKFYSHDSYHCMHDCIAFADAQGTITQVKYAGKYYGKAWEGQTGDGKYRRYDSYSKKYVSSGPSALDRSRANMYLLFNFGLLFVSYFMYQNVGRMRDIVAIDDENEGGLEYYKNKKARKNKTSLLINDYHNPELYSAKNAPGIFGRGSKNTDKGHLLSVAPKNSRSALVAEKMKEKIKQPKTKKPQTVETAFAALSSTNSIHSNLKVKQAMKSNSNKNKPQSLKKQVIENRRAQSELKASLYEAPNLKKIQTAFDKEKAGKKVAKVIEKHKNSFHAKKEHSGQRDGVARNLGTVFENY